MRVFNAIIWASLRLYKALYGLYRVREPEAQRVSFVFYSCPRGRFCEVFQFSLEHFLAQGLFAR